MLRVSCVRRRPLSETLVASIVAKVPSMHSPEIQLCKLQSVRIMILLLLVNACAAFSTDGLRLRHSREMFTFVSLRKSLPLGLNLSNTPTDFHFFIANQHHLPNIPLTYTMEEEVAALVCCTLLGVAYLVPTFVPRSSITARACARPGVSFSA